jgi:hypothetical protein
MNKYEAHSALAEIDFDYILNSICDTEEVNEDNYYDYLHEAIEGYVMRYDYEMEKLVNDYGVFKAIKLYKDDFGEYVIDDNESKNYLTLGYIIIKKLFDDKYPDYTDVMKAFENKSEECEHSDSGDECEKFELEEVFQAFAIHCN